MVTYLRALRSSTAILATLVLAAVTPAGAQSPCGAMVDNCLDDFTCYKITAPFPDPTTVSLEDQFEVASALVTKPGQICKPSNKNDEGLLDADTHLAFYRIRRQTPEHIQRTAIKVTNQLGDLWVDTLVPSALLVPTAVDLSSLPPPPNPSSHDVDHFKCYRVRVTSGTPRFATNTLVSAEDSFSGSARLLSLAKPRYLCNPVDKNGEGIKRPDVHLMCYNAKPAIGQPRHSSVHGLFMNNQLTAASVNTKKEILFCIPSQKSFSP
jgi:hypothetical protein